MEKLGDLLIHSMAGRVILMEFTKMHGCGNDYIYIDGSREQVVPEEKPGLVRTLSDRHFGIGSDGVIFINPSERADFEMEMYNADGTRSEMCGNGIRCVAKYVYDNGLTDKKCITVESAGRVKILNLAIQDQKVILVKVNMGEPEFEAARIPVLTEKAQFINQSVAADGKRYKITCVSMGNPHAVVFVEDVDLFPVHRVGPILERDVRFPNKTNVEFVQIVNKSVIKMRVWERGTGETLACGTGACAAVAACLKNGLTDEQVTVRLPGGELEIFRSKRDNCMYMTGPAVTLFKGEI